MENKYIKKAVEIFESIVSETTITKPGGLPYLIFGEQPSYHSLFNKVGKNFEKWFIYVVESNGFELIGNIDKKIKVMGERKDMDLLFKDKNNDIIYYIEMKSNTNLDTEKFKATCNKINDIKTVLSNQYNGYEVKSFLLHWSVYEKDDLDNKYKNKHLKYNKNNIEVIHPKDLFTILGEDIPKEEYYSLFLEMKNIYNKINL